MKPIIYIVTIFFAVAELSAQQIVINEVMTKNQSVFYDESGSTPDWIEIYNSGSTTINLLNYAISDRKTGKEIWMFPVYNLEPDSFLVLCASGKDKRDVVNRWETIIDMGDSWKYKAGSASIPPNWKSVDFNDNTWASGNSGFGYGDNDDATVLSNTVSVYVRKNFEVADAGNITAAVLHVDYDDGFIAYLNGIEIARMNMGVEGTEVPYDFFASSNHEAQIYSEGKPEAFTVDSISGILNSGTNVLALEVHNVSSTSSDLSLIPFFTIGFNEASPAPNDVPGMLDLPKTRLHTNFSLSAAGESLYLFNADSLIIDSLLIPGLSPDISFGRTLGQLDSTSFFLIPTPGTENSAEGYNEKTEPAVASVASGFYNSSVQVEISISNGDSSAAIFYTLDGSIPSSNSTKYNSPVIINKTTVLRIVAIKPGALPSFVNSYTYLINFYTDLPVISLITDPPNLWDFYEGIYVKGPNAESSNPYFGANFWQDWEKEAVIQFFEDDKSLAFETDLGIKIFGAWSRAWGMKSLSLFARNKYGNQYIKHKIFPELPYKKYSSLILRNSGNDFERTMFRDAFMQVLVEDLNIDCQAYRPAVVYINGEYWGIHNIREKINEDYIARHHDLSPSEIDILEQNANIVEGSNLDYKELIQFIETHSLSIDENYDEVENRIDIDNFIDYFTAQIFFDNTDWPGNNIKFWRHQSDEGKWRWLLYDTDFGFGIYNASNYTNNTLRFALATNGPDWPNPPWSTFLLRNLVKNKNFKTRFINRFADLTNTIFAPSHISNIIDSLKNRVDQEMPRHISRWNAFSFSRWEDNVENMVNFGTYRAQSLRNYYRSEFGISSHYTLAIHNNNTNGGTVEINSIRTDKSNWQGIYFTGIEITLKALPKQGYNFVGWLGDVQSADEVIRIIPTGSTNIQAVFEADVYMNSIVINEINYNSSPDHDTEDWIELYNRSEQDFNLSGWYISDSEPGDRFMLPNRVIIKAGEFLILTHDSTAFNNYYGNQTQIAGDFSFALSNGGDEIKLYDFNNILIDSVSYDDAAPWPLEPDGKGKTLSLKNPDLDNSNAENWSSSLGNGTPGFKNDIFITEVEKDNLLPDEYSLSRNYPNPFNPSTIIEYSLPGIPGKDYLQVRLVVFDILGREVVTLVDAMQKAGLYKINFDADKIPSGVYFYRLTAGQFSKSRKMILIR